jgi:hypothetical protein
MAGVKQQEATVTMADGKVLDLVVTNPDMVRWDMTAHKHKWPTMSDAPMLWATFVTWRAAVRTGVYAGKWEDWMDTDCVSVEMEVDTEDEDPTQ